MGQNVINCSSSRKRILNIIYCGVCVCVGGGGGGGGGGGQVNINHTSDRRFKERLQMLPEIRLKLFL